MNTDMQHKLHESKSTTEYILAESARLDKQDAYNTIFHASSQLTRIEKKSGYLKVILLEWLSDALYKCRNSVYKASMRVKNLCGFVSPPNFNKKEKK